MKIADLLKASRQIMFDTGIEGFEYAISGSGFLCRLGSRDFVVTAQHVVQGVSPDLFRVLFHSRSRSFVPHNAYASPRVPDANDTDWADLAIFPLDRRLYADEDFGDEQPYVLPGSIMSSQPGMKGQFLMRGSPHDRSSIDYDTGLVKQQAVILTAKAVGPSPMKHCVEIMFDDVSACNTLNGFSGTPVLWVGDGQPRQHCFAGPLLRGTHKSKRGHFVNAAIVLAALGKT